MTIQTTKTMKYHTSSIKLNKKTTENKLNLNFKTSKVPGKVTRIIEYCIILVCIRLKSKPIYLSVKQNLLTKYYIITVAMYYNIIRSIIIIIITVNR